MENFINTVIDILTAVLTGYTKMKGEKMEKEKLAKYIVIDIYEGELLIGKYNTKKEALKAADEHIEDTDGECHIMIGVLNEE